MALRLLRIGATRSRCLSRHRRSLSSAVSSLSRCSLPSGSSSGSSCCARSFSTKPPKPPIDIEQLSADLLEELTSPKKSDSDATDTQELAKDPEAEISNMELPGGYAIEFSGDLEFEDVDLDEMIEAKRKEEQEEERKLDAEQQAIDNSSNSNNSDSNDSYEGDLGAFDLDDDDLFGDDLNSLDDSGAAAAQEREAGVQHKFLSDLAQRKGFDSLEFEDVMEYHLQLESIMDTVAYQADDDTDHPDPKNPNFKVQDPEAYFKYEVDRSWKMQKCFFTYHGVGDLHYTNTHLLNLFLSPFGNILPRSETHLTAKMQRKLARTIKKARQAGLLPYKGSWASIRTPHIGHVDEFPDEDASNVGLINRNA